MTISYTKTTWADGSDGGTAIDAAKLNNIENGVDATVTQVNTNTTDIATLKDSASQELSTTNASLVIVRKSGNVVTLEFTGLKNLVVDNSVTIATVPVGYRPSAQVCYEKHTKDGGRFRLFVNTTGAFNVYTYNASGVSSIRDTIMWLI